MTYFVLLCVERSGVVVWIGLDQVSNAALRHGIIRCGSDESLSANWKIIMQLLCMQKKDGGTEK